MSVYVSFILWHWYVVHSLFVIAVVVVCVFILQFIFAFRCVIIAHHLSDECANNCYRVQNNGTWTTLYVYVYIYIHYKFKENRHEEKKLVKRFSALRMCATKTYGLISSSLSEKCLCIICFPSSLCNCVKKQRFAFAVQLNAMSIHTLKSDTKAQIHHGEKMQYDTKQTGTIAFFWHFKWINRISVLLYDDFFIFAKYSNKRWLHFHLEMIIIIQEVNRCQT